MCTTPLIWCAGKTSASAVFPFLLYHHTCPSVYVGLYAILDITQHMIKLCADGTWLSVLADDVTLLILQVVDTLNGRDDGCCATSTCLLEGLQFLFRYLPALHFHTQVDGQLHQTLVGDGW